MNKYPSNRPELGDLGLEKHKIPRKECEQCGKVLYTSKADARHSLVGQLASKSVRVYECPQHKGQWHMTKVWKRKKHESKDKTTKIT